MHYVPDNPRSVLSERARQAFDNAQNELEAARQQSTPGSTSKKTDKRIRDAEKNLQRAKQALAADLRIVEEPNTEELDRARAIAPATRSRQGRYFPSVTPDDAVVHFVWDSSPSSEHREALSALSRRVVRIGHSSSLVRCSLHDIAPDANWFPDDRDGDVVLRVVGPGQLASLEEEFARHLESEPRILPCRFQLYRRGQRVTVPPEHESMFDDDWIIFRRIAGPRLSTRSSAQIALAVRGALMSYADQPPAGILSGHADNGGPSQIPHVAFVPLPFVGHEHADGSVLGVALVMPRDTQANDRQVVFRAVARWEAAHRTEDEESPAVPLNLGTAGRLTLERLAWGVPQQVSLRPGAWSRPSRHWLSVTPVALDRNPGDLYASDPSKSAAAYQEAAGVVAAACAHVGLPRPRVEILPSATLSGTIKAKHFPPFPPDPKKTRRVKVHAFLHFEEPVCGPILLGAGRYVGLGLFRPMPEQEVSHGGAQP
jgi:CRISPR-associated protein Csb2